jgi:hypothetical protein
VTAKATIDVSERRKLFVVVFWSRDPDGTQHNQGDSLSQLSPGINGPTSKLPCGTQTRTCSKS